MDHGGIAGYRVTKIAARCGEPNVPELDLEFQEFKYRLPGGNA